MNNALTEMLLLILDMGYSKYPDLYSTSNDNHWIEGESIQSLFEPELNENDPVDSISFKILKDENGNYYPDCYINYNSGNFESISIEDCYYYFKQAFNNYEN